MIQEQLKKIKAKKMMLWFSMISMTMTFGGLTSAYIVSSSRQDWLEGFNLPGSFLISTICILLSSFTFYLSKKGMLKGSLSLQIFFLWLTIILSILFIYFQINGFKEIVDQGYYFTGAESSITTSFLYILVMLHVFHFLAGMIVLIVVTINSYRRLYNSENKLGFELALIFWHFLDLLWLYLYIFLTAYN